MEYIIDLRFEDRNYSALIHFVTTFIVKNEVEASLFVDELKAGFDREGMLILNLSFNRIDNNPVLRERSYEYYEFCKTISTASIQVEQFLIENPDQAKSLVENMTEKLLNGENSTAFIGNKYNIPVKVVDKKTRNPISAEFYYFNIEHLIPKA